MKAFSLVLCLLAVSFIFSMSSGALGGKKPDLNGAAKKEWSILVKKLDADKDGRLNQAEFSKLEKVKFYSGVKLNQIDSNKDGFINESEFVSYFLKTYSKK